jgi:predicted Na+-dependent transporter
MKRGIMAAVLLTILGVGVGWLVGGANVNTRRVLALSTGTRNFTVALVLASQSFDDPRVEIMVIVTAVVGLLWHRRRASLLRQVEHCIAWTSGNC